jgi:Xaa-Pro aminopeptidase
LDRAREALEASEFGALLLFDFYNIRYVSGTWIGGALGDKMSRYCLLTRDHEPMVWDFGSAARHHNSSRPGWNPRTVVPGCWDCAGRLPHGRSLRIGGQGDRRAILTDHGVARSAHWHRHRRTAVPLRDAGGRYRVRDAQQTMLDARQIKSRTK